MDSGEFVISGLAEREFGLRNGLRSREAEGAFDPISQAAYAPASRRGIYLCISNNLTRVPSLDLDTFVSHEHCPASEILTVVCSIHLTTCPVHFLALHSIASRNPSSRQSRAHSLRSLHKHARRTAKFRVAGSAYRQPTNTLTHCTQCSSARRPERASTE